MHPEWDFFCKLALLVETVLETSHFSKIQPTKVRLFFAPDKKFILRALFQEDHPGTNVVFMNG